MVVVIEEVIMLTNKEIKEIISPFFRVIGDPYRGTDVVPGGLMDLARAIEKAVLKKQGGNNVK